MEESGEAQSTDLELEPFQESTFSEMESKIQTIMQRDAFSQLRLTFSLSLCPPSPCIKHQCLVRQQSCEK